MQSLTKWQKCKAVSSHGELVEAGQLAEVARNMAEVVAVSGEVLQRKAQVQPLGQGQQTIAGDIQCLQLLQVANLYNPVSTNT